MRDASRISVSVGVAQPFLLDLANATTKHGNLLSAARKPFCHLLILSSDPALVLGLWARLYRRLLTVLAMEALPVDAPADHAGEGESIPHPSL